MSAKRILVTGSRDWTDVAEIRRALEAEWEPGAVLVHGACRGADVMAADLWLDLHGPHTQEPHPADWNRYGRRAGFVRNAEMVEAGADVCLAFIRAESRGATMCADLAERAGIPTLRFTEEAES